MSVIFPYDFYKPPALTELEPTCFEKSGFHSNVIYFDRKNDYGKKKKKKERNWISVTKRIKTEGHNKKLYQVKLEFWR